MALWVQRRVREAAREVMRELAKHVAVLLCRWAPLCITMADSAPNAAIVACR